MNKDDKAWADYSKRFRREVLPKILDSAMFMTIGTDTADFDVQMATQLGAAILLDKPLLVVVPPGRNISNRLRLAADIVVDNWDPTTEGSQERMADALDILRRRGGNDSGGYI